MNKMTKDKKIEILTMRVNGYSVRKICKATGFSKQCIYNLFYSLFGNLSSCVYENVRIWLIEKEMDYEELAEKAEMSSRYLKEIENGGRVPSFHKIRKLVRALNVPPEPLFYPNNHTDNLDYQRLLMYLSKCNDEQITAILAIVEAYLRTYKIPTDHDKQDP